ncbi:MAG: preprotein translocase subunit SecG [Candidatus Niyogibacteria bacterium]|nr:MAG: preprotein translocase subunit SecG [Candidatus Niyogibacteria bacterium]
MAFIKTLLPYAQIVVALLLVGAILLQQRGVGLGSAFGGEGNIYRTKRGFEKVIFTSTVILGAIFLILAILGLF